jgi:transcriptional regulator with XRE-family HTH domain
LRGQRPQPPGYPDTLHTVGDHLKRCRLDLGLKQVEAARQLGVCRATLANWEWGRAHPPVGRMPAVIAFLGYDPHPDPKTVGETLRAYRRALGLTQRELCAQLGMHRSTVSKLETGKERPSEAMLRRMQELLGALI